MIGGWVCAWSSPWFSFSQRDFFHNSAVRAPRRVPSVLSANCSRQDLEKMTATGLQRGTFTLKVRVIYLYFCSLNAIFSHHSALTALWRVLSALSENSFRQENAPILAIWKKWRLLESNVGPSHWRPTLLACILSSQCKFSRCPPVTALRRFPSAVSANSSHLENAPICAMWKKWQRSDSNPRASAINATGLTTRPFMHQNLRKSAKYRTDRFHVNSPKNESLAAATCCEILVLLLNLGVSHLLWRPTLEILGQNRPNFRPISRVE